MVAQALIVAAGGALAFGGLMLMQPWMQRLAVGVGIVLSGMLIGRGLIRLDGDVLMGGLMLLSAMLMLDAVLIHLQRERHSPSGQAPGGAHAPGEAGKRDGERNAPMLPGGCTTAGRAGRPRSFSGGKP